MPTHAETESPTATPPRLGPFWLRSIARRPAAAIWLAVLSAAAVAVSLQTPWLQDAVQVRTLAEATAPDRADDTRILLVASSNATADGALSDLGSQEALLTDTPPLHVAGRVILTATGVAWKAAGSDDPQAGQGIAWPSGCPGMRIVSGRCPRTATEVIVPSTVSTPSISLDPSGNEFTVVGTYDATVPGGALGRPLSDAIGDRGTADAAGLVVTRAGLARLGPPPIAFADIELRRSLLPSEVKPVRSAIAAARVSARDNFSGAAVITRLTTVLATVATQQSAAGVLLAFTGIQALGVAWFAEGLLVARISRARAREWGVARLRGLSRRRRIGGVLAEPVVAVLVGSAAGVALGAGVATLVSTAVVGPTGGPPLGDPLLWTAAALAVVGSLVALVAASIRSTRIPLDDLLRASVEPRRITRTGLVVQSVTVMVTVVVIAAVLTQGRITGLQLPVLAPILVAATVGILALRVAVLVVRGTTRRTPSRLAGVVVGRRLGRTPSAFTSATAVVLAITLLAFTAETAIVGARLQADRADATVAATTVAHVRTPRGLSLRTAVDRADPGGHRALAAKVIPDSIGTTRVVAVDTSRLAAVTSWRATWAGRSFAALRRELAPAVGPSLILKGTVLNVRLRSVAAPLTRLVVVVETPSGWHKVRVGTMRNGDLSSKAGALPCSRGCRLVWLGLDNLSYSPLEFDSQFTISALSTDQQSEADLAPWLNPDRWRLRYGDQSDPSSAPTALILSSSGLRVVAKQPDGTHSFSISPRDAPEPLPALIGPQTETDPFPTVRKSILGSDLDRTSLLLHSVGRASVLPRVLGDGALVDLRLIDRLSDPGHQYAEDQVWISPGPTAGILAALHRQGVRVDSVEHLAATTKDFQREAQSLAAALALPTGVFQALLVLLALIAVRTVDVEARRRDAGALREAGVAGSRLRRLGRIELLVPNAAAVLLGAAAGAGVFALVASGLPFFAADGSTPPSDLSPAWIVLGLATGAALVAVILLALVVPPLELRGTGGAGRRRR